jgi:hypothetical protein
MDIYTQMLKSRPLTAFALNPAATAYVDLTNRGVTLSATPPLTSMGTVAGSFKAAVVTGGTSYNFSTKVFRRTQEKRGFSLQATVTTRDTNTGFISVLSHNAVEDGLYVKGNEVRFTVEFNTLGSVTASAPISPVSGSVTVHAVYSVAKVQIYINGVLASEVNITPEQIADGFKSRASSNLYISQGTVGKRLIVDAVAVYSRALTDAEIYLHSSASKAVVNHSDAASSAGATTMLDGGVDSRNINFHRVWKDGNWSTDAVPSGVTYSGGLSSGVDDTTGLTTAGTWTVAVNTSDLPTLYGLVARWNGRGNPVVQASLDEGVTWLAMTNGLVLPESFGLDVTNKTLVVRVQFPAGEQPGVTSVTSFELTTYQDNTIRTSNSQKTALASIYTTTSDVDYDGAIGQGYVGVFITGGKTPLSADSEADPDNFFSAIETLVSFNKIKSNGYVYDLRPGVTNGFLWYGASNLLTWSVGTVYVNGSAVTSGTYTIIEGVKYHIVHVLPSSYNSSVDFGPNIVGGENQYEFLNLYPALTAAQIKSLYEANIRVPRVRLSTDASPVSESGYSSYQHDWALTPAGL